MQKEKKIRTYTRKTKTGKTVTVKAHTAKYDAAEEARKAFAKKAGAGEELSEVKKEKVAPAVNDDLGFSAEDYKAWYHWDTESDPKNASALKVKKALIAKMGRSAYSKYEKQMTEGYSARGHLKAFKGLGDRVKVEQETTTRQKEGKFGSLPASPKNAAEIYKQMSNPRNNISFMKKGKNGTVVEWTDESDPKKTPTKKMLAETKQRADEMMEKMFGEGWQKLVKPGSSARPKKESAPKEKPEKGVGLKAVDASLARRVMRDEDFDSLKDAKNYLAEMPRGAYNHYVASYKKSAEKEAHENTLEGIRESHSKYRAGFHRYMGAKATAAKKTLIAGGYTEVRGVPEISKKTGKRIGSYTGLIGPDGDVYLYRGGGYDTPALLNKASRESKKAVLAHYKSKATPKKAKVDDLAANHAKEVASAKTVQDKWKLLDKWYRRKEIGVHPSDMQKLRASAKTGFSQKEKQVINKLFKTFSV